jgi:uncharacterized membrane protein YfhO
VVLTDTFYPGWQATVNDQPAKIWQANLAFRAVAVETGRQQIIFSYRPYSFYLGLWTSIASILVIGGLLWKRPGKKEGACAASNNTPISQ